jgi:CRP-like cAMP-binding protein
LHLLGQPDTFLAAQRQGEKASAVRFLLQGTASAFQLVPSTQGGWVRATLSRQLGPAALFGSECSDLRGLSKYAYSVQATTTVTMLQLTARQLSQHAAGKEVLDRLGHYAKQQPPSMEMISRQLADARSRLVRAQVKGASAQQVATVGKVATRLRDDLTLIQQLETQAALSVEGAVAMELAWQNLSNRIRDSEKPYARPSRNMAAGLKGVAAAVAPPGTAHRGVAGSVALDSRAHEDIAIADSHSCGFYATAAPGAP